MRPKEHAFGFDPIEGSDTLSMVTITANYEGTYGDLLQFVNRLDKSPRFLILDTLTAAPQQGGTNLNVNIKLNTFVREDRGVKRPTRHDRHDGREATEGAVHRVSVLPGGALAAAREVDRLGVEDGAQDRVGRGCE